MNPHQSPHFPTIFMFVMLLCTNLFSFDQELKVAIKPIAPFVMEEKNQIKGFSIDLWKEIAKDLNISYRFVMKDSVSSLLESVQKGKSDVGIAAITINAQRSQVVDFSKPFPKGILIAMP